MDPATLIATALIAGTAAGASNTASRTVETAVQALQTAVRRRLANGHNDAPTLDAYLQDPVAGHASLVEGLRNAGADHDAALIHAAGRVFALTHPGIRQWSIDLSRSQGTAVGDGNIQTNIFPSASAK